MVAHGRLDCLSKLIIKNGLALKSLRYQIREVQNYFFCVSVWRNNRLVDMFSGLKSLKYQTSEVQN